MTERDIQIKLIAKLKRIYGDENVLDTSGVQEFGVDLVFVKKIDNVFPEEEIVIGVQLKREDMLGAPSATIAIGQITIALGHDFMVGRTENGRNLDLAYIANYGEFHRNAKDYFREAKKTLKCLKWIDINVLGPYLLDELDSGDFNEENPNA